MKKSIFLKTLLSYLFLMVAVALLVFLFATNTIKAQYLQGIDQTLDHLAAAVNQNFLPWLKTNDETTLDRLAKELGKEIEARITLIASNGRVLADSQADPRRMENHADRPEFILAIRGKPAEITRFSPTLRQPMLYRAVPMKSDGRIIGVLRISLLLSTIEQVIGQAKKEVIIWLAILLALALAAAFLFARHLTDPIRQLTRAAQRVANGDFATRVRLNRRDELKQLADDFNHMIERQQVLLESSRRQQLELETILASIGEGLLVLNREGRIILANQSFQAICQQTECRDRPYWETLRDSRFNELVQQALETNQDTRGELDINDRVLLIRVSALPEAGPLIVTFSDISEYKRLEKIKRDFVSNLSHELRTPLTAIKGFVETLVDESTAQNRDYLNIIRRHTDRLVNLVNDLLSLSEMEEPRMRLEKAPLDLLQIAENVVKIFAARCREKGIRLDIDAESAMPRFFGDPYRLEQLFINLVDNAVKYTERGEILIDIKSRTQEVEIRVKDSGPGIAAEHLPRIFERFYVADRARSREQGGTGLGLAIVKHIVLLHDGQIRVESRPGQGTEFIVTLPRISPS